MKKNNSYKTAISRSSFSAPVRLLLARNLLQGSFLDYGCGRGDDVRRLKQQGIKAFGWDPFYSPDQKPTRADVVNLGYVLNVIQNPKQRKATLLDAWKLAVKLLVVTVRTDKVKGTPIGDGILTSKGTFQKIFSREEIRKYIVSVLKKEPEIVNSRICLITKD